MKFYMEKMCRSTCGLCNTIAQDPLNPNCRDKIPNCNALKSQCNDSFYRKIMLDVCQKSCDLCDEIVITSTISPPIYRQNRGKNPSKNIVLRECSKLSDSFQSSGAINPFVDVASNCPEMEYLCENTVIFY